MLRSICCASLVLTVAGCSCSTDMPSNDGGTGGGAGSAGGGAGGAGGGTGGVGGGVAGGAGGGTACTAATTCSGHGTCAANGSCTCATGFTGASCNACATDYYGFPACSFCSAATTCSGHGTCAANGSCTCATGFTGASCDACATDYYGFPACNFCSAATTCSGQGTCAANGSCACATGFTGASCNACAPDYYGFPMCRFCSAATTCNAHGTCSTTGTCACSSGFADAGCDECAAGFTGYPACAPPLSQAVAAPFTHRGPDSPDVVFTADGGIFVAHTTFTSELLVSTLVNGAWQQLGPPVSDAGVGLGARPAMVATPSGLVVMYLQSNIIKTRRFDGTDWQVIPYSQSGGLFFSPRPMDLVVDSQGRAVSVSVESGSLQTRRLEAGGWVDFGPPFHSASYVVRAVLRSDDTLVAVVTTTLPPFGTGVFVAEQSTDAGWSMLGNNPVDSIGDTTTQIVGTDIDVSGTATFASWNKGTCNQLPRFVARATLPAWSQVGEAGATGNDVTSLIDGAGLVQSFSSNCVSSTRMVQRWTGTAWNTALTLPDDMHSAELHRSGGSIYLGYFNANVATGNVVRLNVP